MSLDRRKPWVVGGSALVALVLGLAPAFAQGTQTGVITGIVKATDGAALPGVTVTLSSPALQGVRTITSDATGAYHFRGLPP
ncbi:MAG TPA: carboxypeptidase-like regulatory domain-containing protein, partial [Vicinamibacteria bacterium]